MEEDSSNTRNVGGEADSEVEENTEDKTEEAKASSKLVIFSSDEEDTVDFQTRIKRKKKRKRVMEFSGGSLSGTEGREKILIKKNICLCVRI